MRRLHLALALLAGLGFWTGCEKKPSGPALDPHMLRVGLEAEPQVFDPRYHLDAYSDRVNKLLYRGLFQIDRNGNAVPDLADTYQFFGNASGETYLDVTLVQDAVFHNGNSVRLEDVLYTFSNVLQSSDSPRLGAIKQVRAVTRVTDAQGDRIRFILSEPFAPLLSALVMGIVPAGSGKELKQHPVGSGPFKLVRRANGSITLQRHPEPLPDKINTIELRVFKNDTARALALENGEIDLVQNALAPQDLARFDADERFIVSREPGSNVSYLGFNHKDKLLADPRVRQAISMAINRNAIVGALLADTATPTGTILPATNWAYQPVTADPYDLEKAAQLLNQAGFKPGTDGTRFSLEYKTSTNRSRIRIAEAIAQTLGQVGIKIKITSLDFGTFFDHVRQGNFQIYTLTWTGLTEPDILYSAFSSAAFPPQGANRGRFSDPDIDRWTRTARKSLHSTERQQLYAKIQYRLAELRPYAVLWGHDAVIVRSVQVAPVKPFPDGSLMALADLPARTD